MPILTSKRIFAKILIIVCLFIGASQSTYSQTGDSCSSPLPLDSCATASLSPGQTVWYNFTGLAKAMQITVARISGAPNVIKSAILYASCYSAPLVMDTTQLQNDSLKITDTNLVIGNVYYIRLTAGDNNSSSVVYTICTHRIENSMCYVCGTYYSQCNASNTTCCSGPRGSGDVCGNAPKICYGTSITFSGADLFSIDGGAFSSVTTYILAPGSHIIAGESIQNNIVEVCLPLSVSVVAPGATPTLTITPSNVCEGGNISINGMLSPDACSSNSGYYTISPDPNNNNNNNTGFTFECAGGPQLNACYIYSGPICANSPNPPYNPLNIPPGTYTLTLHETGTCGPTSTSQVFTINPMMPLFTASIDCSNSLILNYNGQCPSGLPNQNYTMTWDFGDGSPDVNGYPLPSPAHIYTSPGTYIVTLTVTNNICNDIATYSRTVTVGAATCCLAGDGGSTITGPAYSNNEPNPLTGAGQSTISGTFYINNTYTINATNVAMFTGAVIDVQQGATLIIDNARLYACHNMWQGIQVEAGGSLIVKKSSIIEDAMQAINLEQSGGGSFLYPHVEISHSTLNNNYYDIAMTPSSMDEGLFDLVLTGSTLTTSVDAGYSNNAYLKPPFNPGMLTEAGVYMSNVGAENTVSVGQATSAADKNTFSNMRYGVYAINSSFSVYNNKFENLKGGHPQLCTSPPCPPPTGIAVYAIASNYNEVQGTQVYYYNALIGGTGSFQSNKMKDCNRGVDITKYAYPIISNNIMTNTTNIPLPGPNNYPLYGDHGIFIKTTVQPGIIYNHIHNFIVGIHLNDFVDQLDCFVPNPYLSSPISLISENEITANNQGEMQIGALAENSFPFGNYCSFSFIQSAPLYEHPLEISNNNISDARYACVYLNNNSANSGLYPTSVTASNNTLSIYPSSTATDKSQRAGVLLTGNNGQIGVYDNYITGQNTLLLPNDGSYADTSVIGIRSILSTSATGFGIQCNEIHNVGQCLRWEGNGDPNFVYRNKMYKCYDDWVLWNSGEIGQQGTATMPIGDEWVIPPLDYETWTQNSDATFSPIYVLSSPSFYNPTPNNGCCGPGNIPYGNASTIFNSSGSVPPCPCPNCSPVKNFRQNAMHRVIHDSVTYSVFVPQSAYIARQSVFAQLTIDTSLLTGDTVLQNFYNHAPATNIGKISRITQLIAADSIVAATAQNNALAPANTIEANYQTAYTIYLNTLAINYDTIDSLQYVQLYNIAMQCPLEGGKAVFLARTMLNRLMNTSIIFPNNCDSVIDTVLHRPRKFIDGGNHNIYSSLINVYPNPANTILNVKTELANGQTESICIYNALGQCIKCLQLSVNLTVIPVSDLSEGIYLYRITDLQGNQLKSDKFMLVR